MAAAKENPCQRKRAAKLDLKLNRRYSAFAN